MPIMINARARAFSDSDKPFAVEICRVAMLSTRLGDEAAYSRADLDKLATLKRRYDPDNLFRHTKSIAA